MKRDDPKPFAQKAAEASVISFGLVIVVNAVGQSLGSKTIWDVVTICLASTGLISGIVGLCGVRKRGMRHIFLPSLSGIILNGLIMSIWIANFMRALTNHA